MRHLLKLAFCILLVSLLINLSCKKETSCEDCREGNKPPIALAGPDQIITLPTDIIALDGSASNDPDGTISEWLWTKISGPASFNIVSATTAKTVVKNLAAGVYQFELKVTDNGGLSAKDTVQIIVNDPTQLNQPPVANAGSDQTITLPSNTVTLDGSASTDPDNNITGYAWIKISGPSSFNIANVNAVQTQVNNLVQGVYQFELKVTDAGGLFSKDTAQITVNAAVVIVACDGSIRPQVNAQLIPFGTLSQTREGIAVESAGNKILYAGGYTTSGYIPSSRVDIFDITTNTWTTAELSQARFTLATAVLGNKIFFAGGIYRSATGNYNVIGSSRVDIYDAADNIWTTAELSIGRAIMTGAAAGNKVLFAGGLAATVLSAPPVDIYDASTNTWSTDTLRNRPIAGIVGDAGIAATVIGNKIYFAGNASDWLGWDFGSISSTINIYDASANTWSTSDLSIARGFMAAIAVGNKNYWAGGVFRQPSDPFTNLVEIRDINSGLSSFGCLFQPNAFLSAVLKNNKIVFFTSQEEWPPGNVKDKFDIYDITTNIWSIGVLPQSIYGASIISVNNTIYVAGGNVNGILSNQVWKLEF